MSRRLTSWLQRLVGAAEVCHDTLVDLPSEETFKAADDFPFGPTVCCASGDIVDPGLVIAHADHDRSVERGVRVTVTDPIESVPTGGHPGRGRDRIGFVFQSYDLLPVLTAYENAEIVMAAQGVDEDGRRRQVMDLLARVGSRIGVPQSSRAASSSASRLRGRSRPTRRSCSPPSRPPTSIRPPLTACLT